ncbi:MAG: signal peptidase II [Patescibacteria group bacterium]|nr:signal peptidase II [Patescibacteria group bacterium]MDD5164102.1 signal peptidase II [Patescibacteria group bacterium]MDD5534240.1 signal peptidase II [Patescibacteria group bacterium]
MKNKLILINILVLFFFILDRLFKKIALLDRTIGNSFFNFSLFKNPNLALSIPFNGILFYFLLIIIFWWLVDNLIKSYRTNNILKVLAFSLIFAGAISNLLDRLEYKAVIDYLNIFYFSVVNLADLMISGGLIILILSEFSSYLAQKNSGTK